MLILSLIVRYCAVPFAAEEDTECRAKDYTLANIPKWLIKMFGKHGFLILTNMDKFWNYELSRTSNNLDVIKESHKEFNVYFDFYLISGDGHKFLFSEAFDYLLTVCNRKKLNYSMQRLARYAKVNPETTMNFSNNGRKLLKDIQKGL